MKPTTDKSPRSLLANYHSPDNHDDREAYRNRYTCKPNCDPENGGPPYFSIINIIICLACFGYYNFGDDPQKALMQSALIYNPCEKAQFWRLFTYSFLHADIGHIVSNLIIFALVGPLLELVHDTPRPLAIYVVGVVMGGILSGILSDKYLVGASGGCYALVFAHLANIIQNGDIMNKKALMVRLVVLVPLIAAALFDLYLAIQRYSNIDSFRNGHGGGGGVSYAAHIAGAFTGLTFGLPVLRNFEVAKWEKPCKVAASVIFGLVAVTIVIFYIMGGTPFWDPTSRCA